ncbi:MAG: aldo/keto reductase [Myxococcales bacterium]|nr:aldo/keto reductase [Myxococcales bacterium]
MPRGDSEKMLGKALGDKRASVIVATKFSGATGDSPLDRGGSKRYIHRAVEASLERLGTDYIDLYQMHFPDADTPIEETLEALGEIVRAGKVRYIGCSNFAGWMLVEALHVARERGYPGFVSAQNHHNLLERKIRHELIPACEKYAVGILPYFPLASGVLTGKYRRGEAPDKDTRLGLWGERASRMLTDETFDKIEALEGFAKERERTLLDVASGWLLSQSSVSSVIAGATKPEQVESNVAAGGFRLDGAEMAALEKML